MNILVWGLHPSVPVSDTPVIAAMGVFDGVHKGHQTLLNAALKDAKSLGADPWVITFLPNPARALTPETYMGDIQTMKQKLEILKALGFAGVIILPFDEQFRQITAQDFLVTLLDWVPLAALRVGENFHLGRYPGKEAGEISGLCQKLGKKLRVDITPLANHNGDPISSTKVRRCILDGDLRTAESLLGRPYELDLRGIPLLRHGDTVGVWRTWSSQVIPRHGSYSIRNHAQPSSHMGVAQIGEHSIVWKGEKKIESLEILQLQPLVPF